MSEASDLLSAALSGRYTLQRELGRGGMATVYLAHDIKHDRAVALKILHAELAATLGPERFQREIRTTAQLQHPPYPASAGLWRSRRTAVVYHGACGDFRRSLEGSGRSGSSASPSRLLMALHRDQEAFAELDRGFPFQYMSFDRVPWALQDARWPKSSATVRRPSTGAATSHGCGGMRTRNFSRWSRRLAKACRD
jgi:serine/threonine protein kinase